MDGAKGRGSVMLGGRLGFLQRGTTQFGETTAEEQLQICLLLGLVKGLRIANSANVFNPALPFPIFLG